MLLASQPAKQPGENPHSNLTKYGSRFIICKLSKQNKGPSCVEYEFEHEQESELESKTQGLRIEVGIVIGENIGGEIWRKTSKAVGHKRPTITSGDILEQLLAIGAAVRSLARSFLPALFLINPRGMHKASSLSATINTSLLFWSHSSLMKMSAAAADAAK